MEQSMGDQYRAVAEECARRAEFSEDENTRTEWLQLAKSWQVLADNAKTAYEIVPSTSTAMGR
jgi:hypothetical protein